MNNGNEQLYLLSSIQTQPPGPVQKQDAVQGTTPRNLDNVQDFSNVCRICATVTQLVVPIFAGEGLEHQLADKIHKHLPIKVAETDQLPLVVCYQCVSTLMAWHELVECSVQADRALKAKIGVTPRTEDVKRESHLSHSTTSAFKLKTEEDAQSKSNTIPNYPQHQQSHPTEQVRDPRTLAAPPAVICDFCHRYIPRETLVKHIILAHQDLILFCNECQQYICKTDYGTHALQHAEMRVRQSQIQTEAAQYWNNYARSNYYMHYR